ncbi:hypothetical protein ABPG72_008110 [Tetrahymena utriculariae]
MIKFIIIAILISLISCKPKWTQLQNYTFEQYVRDFQKEYKADSEEYITRKKIFEQNLADIVAFNKEDHSYKKGVKNNTDESYFEKKEQFSIFKSSLDFQVMDPSTENSNYIYKAKGLTNLPDSVDWRDKGVVSPVKDQGDCLSCWAFTAASVLESHAAIAAGSGNLKTLSTQQLVSCVPNPKQCGGQGGCFGAVADLAFEYISKYGITSEFKYGYKSYFNDTYECKFDPLKQSPEVFNQGFAKITPNDQQALLEAVATIGPIAISIDSTGWDSYEEGVFDGCDYSENINIDHAVVLVGYGTDPKYGDYWLVRNSYGTEFGEDGYIRIKRESEPQCGIDSTPTNGFACGGDETPIKVCGMCGILSDSSYPLKVRVIV